MPSYLFLLKWPSVLPAVLLAASLGLAACAPLAEKPAPSGHEGAGARPAEAQKAPEADAGEDAAKRKTLPGLELTGDTVYEMLLAEIALRRGQPGVAVAAYADLAQGTRDPRIVQRAVELAAVTRQDQLALQLAQLWVDIEPASMKARQMLVSGLVANGRLAEAEPHIGFVMEKDPEHAGVILMRLARSVAASPDKKDLAAMMDRLAAGHPDVPEAHFVSAFSALIAGEKARALDEVRKARSRRPGWEQAALLHAQLLEESGDPAAAMRELQAFLERYPKAADLRLQYAKALVRDKHLAEGREQFRILEKEGASNPDVVHALAVLAVQMNDMEDAEARFKSLLDAGEGNGDVLRMALGQIAESRKKPEEALQWYEAVKPGAQYLDARLKAALIISRVKSLDEALSHLRASRTEAPGDRAQLALAESQLLRNAGRGEEALAVLEKALERFPDQPELLYESALLEEKAGRFQVMEERLRKLIGLQPDFAHAYNALGYSFADRGERLEEAEALIRKALALAPEDPFIQDSLGWVLYRKGDLAGARASLAKALENRADPEIAAHLGEVLWAMGREDEARATWRKAAEAAPDNEALKAAIRKFLGEAQK